MANQNFNQVAAHSPVKCVHKEVPLTPHVQEAENHFAAYYEYKSNRGNLV